MCVKENFGAYILERAKVTNRKNKSARGMTHSLVEVVFILEDSSCLCIFKEGEGVTCTGIPQVYFSYSKFQYRTPVYNNRVIRQS